MTFIKLNLNPRGKKASDCVIRAIAKATNQTWIKVYQDLCAIGLEEYDVITSKKVWQKYLENLDWIKRPMPTDKTVASYKRLTVKEFSERWDSRKPIIVSVSRHLTVVQDGNIYDTWNCENKSVGNYWIK